MELDGPEVDPEGNALPTGAAAATLVALALSWAEGVIAGGEGSGVFNKGRPLSGSGLEEGPPGAAFPNRDHEGGHCLFLAGLDQDPANEAERRVNPQVFTLPILGKGISAGPAWCWIAAPKHRK